MSADKKINVLALENGVFTLFSGVSLFCWIKINEGIREVWILHFLLVYILRGNYIFNYQKKLLLRRLLCDTI